MARRAQRTSSSREIYFEHIAIGNVVKVSAIDSATGTEVSISGPRNTSAKELERIALQKLQLAIARNGGLK